MSFFLISSDDNNDNNYFNGMAFSESSIVLSLSGLENYLKSANSLFELVDGRFSLCWNDGEKRIFTVDRTGQDCWFYYKENDFWAVSNSLYALGERLKERGRFRLRKSGFIFYEIRHSLGEQPYSEETSIDGVKILPKDCYITVSSDFFKVEKHQKLRKVESQEDYCQRLVHYVAVWKARLRSLISHVSAGAVRCDISGGIDSRIVMGLSSSELHNKKIKYSTNKAWNDDYLIVSMLSKALGFKIDNTEISRPRVVSAEKALELYKKGNSGVYKNIYFSKFLTAYPSLHLHGAGGENIRGLSSGSAWKVVHRLKSQFKNDALYEDFRHDYLGWFEKNDIDFKSDDSTIAHYRHFRGRFHFGRNWYRSLTNPLVTPLESSDLEMMADYLIKVGRDPKALQFDMLYLCDKFLPFFPFDTENKKFSHEVISDSLKYIANFSIRKNDFEVTVFGDFPLNSSEECSSVTDMDIKKLALNEISNFSKNATGEYVEVISKLLNDDVNRIKAYGAISIMKLV
ncbi:hypothetical protein FF32_18400 [Halomonas campaniensis]|nr:hypothetical protein FF32_18400 [Halomonas campaniensis]